jgi:hypothetical protein
MFSNINFNINPLGRKFLLIITIFSVILSTGIGSNINSIYLFAESKFQSENNNLQSHLSPNKTDFDQDNPFSSRSNNLKKINDNIILPNTAGSDSLQNFSPIQSSQLQSQPDSESITRPIVKSHLGLMNKNSNSLGQQNLILTQETRDESLTESKPEILVNNNSSSISDNNNNLTPTIADGPISSSAISIPNWAHSSSKIQGDFNGDGKNDLAVGIPGDEASSGSITDAGGVQIIYGSSSGLSATSSIPDQFWTQDSADLDDKGEANDYFGKSLAAGDFNDDGRDDLAIGVPGEDVPGEVAGSTVVDAGGVQILYGSSNGLSATLPRSDQFWTQNTGNVDEVSEEGDYFGSSLSTGDFNGDDKDDLAIGVPYENLGNTNQYHGAGGVNVLYGTSNGLSASSPRSDQFWTQDSIDVNDAVEYEDNFGYSLSAGDFNGDGKDDLAIGAPCDFIASVPCAGGVELIYGSSGGLSATSVRSDQFWTQDSVDVNDMSEQSDYFGSSLTSGDFNGDKKDDLAIGAFGERPAGSNQEDMGAVNVLYGSSGGLSATSVRSDQFWMQGNNDLNDKAEEFDRFGWYLDSGDFNGDGKDDLAIGVPFESVNSLIEAGAVQVIYGSSSGLSTTLPKADQFWTQDSIDIDDTVEAGDSFGFSILAADFNGDGKDDLAIGVPNEDVNLGPAPISNAGAVNVIYGSSKGLSATLSRSDQFWTQNSADIENFVQFFDQFGWGLG